MFGRKTSRFSSPYHAHASVGMPHDATKVWPKEFASATEAGQTLRLATNGKETEPGSENSEDRA